MKMKITISEKTAIWLGLFVAFLWSTSWVLIKIGLEEIPAITFAGFRYSFAFVFLAVMFFRNEGVGTLKQISKQNFITLIVLGIVLYSLTQGSQFVGLVYLPAITLNLILSFTPIIVAIFGLILLSEKPEKVQWLGIVFALLGAIIYFNPLQQDLGLHVGGLLVGGLGLFSNAIATILGRRINQKRVISPLGVTMISMGVGGGLLLFSGLMLYGFPKLGVKSWLIIIWLAVINTAFAFTLWNMLMQKLSAFEMSVINNTMVVQIPILAVLFLGERLSVREVVGLIIVILGLVLVQIKRKGKQ